MGWALEQVTPQDLNGDTPARRVNIWGHSQVIGTHFSVGNRKFANQCSRTTESLVVSQKTPYARCAAPSALDEDSKINRCNAHTKKVPHSVR